MIAEVTTLRPARAGGLLRARCLAGARAGVASGEGVCPLDSANLPQDPGCSETSGSYGGGRLNRRIPLSTERVPPPTHHCEVRPRLRVRLRRAPEAVKRSQRSELLGEVRVVRSFVRKLMRQDECLGGWPLRRGPPADAPDRKPTRCRPPGSPSRPRPLRRQGVRNSFLAAPAPRWRQAHARAGMDKPSPVEATGSSPRQKKRGLLRDLRSTLGHD